VPGHGLGARAAIGQVAQGAADPLRETSAMPFRAATLLRATLAFAFCLSFVTPVSAEPKASTSTYAATLRALNPRLAFAQSVALAETLLEAARKFRLDPTLVMAVVSVESSWNPHAVSYSGARGLGQLMPGTARYLGVGDSESGRENLRGTVRYLHELIHSFHQSPDPPLREQSFHDVACGHAPYRGRGGERAAAGAPRARSQPRHARSSGAGARIVLGRELGSLPHRLGKVGELLDVMLAGISERMFERSDCEARRVG
jgi:hypothetical protein